MPLPQTWVAAPAWAAAQDASDWLLPSELARCHAPPSPRRRADKIAGRLALKHLLHRDFGIGPMAYEIGADGPAPALWDWPGPVGLVVSLSHSGGFGAASWAWASVEGTVGVDIQQERPVRDGLAARALAESERMQGGHVLLIWALKEAAIKAQRRAWGRPLQEIVVTLDHPDAEEGRAEIFLSSAPPLAALYTRQGGCRLARASRPR